MSNIPDGITRADVLGALSDFDGGIDHGFPDSTTYDLAEGGRRYPPKPVVALAARRLLGRLLVPRDFKGGDGTKCFKVLRDLGFSIVPKQLVREWWRSDPAERFWLETTDRSDLGVDLNAPLLDESGNENWGYSLIRHIRPGDIVLHNLKDHGIVSWSRAVGSPWEDTVLWGARGTYAREAGVKPYTRPGLRLGLQGPTTLPTPLTLETLRARRDVIQGVRDGLKKLHPGAPLYFPFEVGKRPLRFFQAYLTKFPADVARAIPELSALAGEIGAALPLEIAPPSASKPSPSVGSAYRPADEDAAVSGRDPQSVDPAIVERGVRGHARTQNALAKWLQDAGLTPLSPDPSSPNFDLAWEDRGTLYVAEVKSITPTNEERQLRLGLGQVLRYRHLYQHSGKSARAVLAVERRPPDDWLDLCRGLEVHVVWPALLAQSPGPLFASLGLAT